MAEEIQDVNKMIDEMDAAVKRYASKDTVISIGGYEFTPAKLVVAATIISSTLGGLYGCFEVYKDYMSMKKKIAEYVSPDLTEFDKRLSVIEQNSAKTTDYTRDIKNDIKTDLRRLETVVEQVERVSKQNARETGQEVKDLRRDMQEVTRSTERDLRNIRTETDTKIRKALDNPLSK